MIDFQADHGTEAPEAAFDRHWAFAVLEQAMRQLETELRDAGKAPVLEQLRPHLQGDRNGRAYAEIAVEWGLSESAVKMTVLRLCQRYAELLRAEVARTVSHDAEVEGEWRHLLGVVSG